MRGPLILSLADMGL